MMPETGVGGLLAGEQLGSLQVLMNMQTQIDLFLLGTRYYSQILINLQIPPVSPASSPCQGPCSQEPGAPEWTPAGGVCRAPRSTGQGKRLALGQAKPEGGESWSCSSSHQRALLSCPGQFTVWHCSSGRGGGNRLVTLGKGKPTCFQRSPNPPPDYDGNKSQAQRRPRPRGRRRPAARCPPLAASWPESVRAARKRLPALLQLGPLLSRSP